MKRIILFLLIIFFHSAFSIAISRSYGLKFHSYNVLGKDRTGLILENNENITIKKNIELSFDLQIRNETLFGSVVRIINETGNSIALSLGPNEKGISSPKLLVNNIIYPINEKIYFNKWFRVKISISNTDHSISLSYNNSSQTIRNLKSEWEKVKICFGSGSLTNFFTEEVPPINLREVKLLRDNKLYRYWRLNKHNVTECYDEIEYAKAIAYNPEWLLDKYTKWTKELTLGFDNTNYTQYAFDSKNNIIYIVPNEKIIIAYNPATNVRNKIEVLGGLPASKSTNQLIFDPLKKQLVSYNLEEQYISTFSFETKRWSNNRMCSQENRFWHHTADFRLTDSSIITFGGYGMYLYKNDLFKISTDNRWQTTKINSVPKRYSAASTIVNDTLFVFSGKGNVLGKQELPIQLYTDLYAIDLKTLNVSLIWRTKSKDVDLPGGNMIYNQQENCFYVLTSRLGGSLIKISRTRPSVELITTNRNQLLEADFNFYTLFKPEKDNKIYAFYCRDYKSGSSKLDSYEILYPPLSRSEVIQPVPLKSNYKSLFLLSVIILGILLLVGFITIKMKNRAKLKPSNSSTLLKIDTREEDGDLEEVVETQHFNRSRKSISLLGAFNVKDSEGNDITNQFAPVLKTIILAVILNNDGGGINSNIIDDLLWPDKDKKSARNNRNVSINRLNNVLENVGDIRIYSESNFWKIEIKDDIFIDYFVVKSLMKFPENEISKNKELASQLIELLSFGQLLPYTHLEWIDSYKAEYSNFSLDFLSSVLAREDVKNNIKARLQVVNIIFLFDSVNENALNIKCNLLYEMGKKGLAKFTYNNFCNEYEALLGEKYPVSFAKIIDINDNSNN